MMVLYWLEIIRGYFLRSGYLKRKFWHHEFFKNTTETFDQASQKWSNEK